MAYDTDLAERIRELVAAEPDLTERRMFGGLAFLLDGAIAVTASSRGGLMVRVDPADADRLVAAPGVERMVMKGRPMRGWLHVDLDVVRTKRQLGPWVRRGIAHARSSSSST